MAQFYAGQTYVTRCGAVTPTMRRVDTDSGEALIAIVNDMFCGWDPASGAVTFIGFMGPTQNSAIKLIGNGESDLDLTGSDCVGPIEFEDLLSRELFRYLEVYVLKSSKRMSLMASLNRTGSRV